MPRSSAAGFFTDKIFSFVIIALTLNQIQIGGDIE
jgi:hypothetical protein